MNTLLPHIAINANERSAGELVSEVIAPNPPYHRQDAFDLAHRTGDTMAQITRMLTLISNQHQHRAPRDNNRNSGSQGGNRSNGNNGNNGSNRKSNNRNGKKFKNKCGVHSGHE